MRQEITRVTSKTIAYMNFASVEFPQLDGQMAHVVDTQVPVRQQARLPKLRTPPILVLLHFNNLLALIFCKSLCSNGFLLVFVLL